MLFINRVAECSPVGEGAVHSITASFVNVYLFVCVLLSHLVLGARYSVG